MSKLNAMNIKFKKQYTSKELPIFSTILTNHEDINPILMDLIKEHRNNFPTSPLVNSENYEENIDHVKSWHSVLQTNLINPNFDWFIDLVNTFVEDISKTFFTNLYFEYFCQDFWIAQYEKDNHTIDHNHFPALFSAVYYVDVEDGCAPLIFEKQTSIIPQNGLLLIFPGILNHIVPQTNTKRTLFAMNFFMKKGS
jgi:hypothetical protein